MKRKPVKIIVALLATLIVSAGVYGAIWWARYPSAPDPSQVSLDESLNFMGGDDFAKLTLAHRKRFAMAVADRTRQLKLEEIVAMMTSGKGGRKSMRKNLGDMPEKDQDEIGGAFLRAFLDNFYSQSSAERQKFLMVTALAEKAARAAKPSTQPSGKKDDETQLPSPEKLQEEMAKFLSNQPPQTVAQMSQLMMDMRRTREFFGMK